MNGGLLPVESGSLVDRTLGDGTKRNPRLWQRHYKNGEMGMHEHAVLLKLWIFPRISAHNQVFFGGGKVLFGDESKLLNNVNKNQLGQCYIVALLRGLVLLPRSVLLRGLFLLALWFGFILAAIQVGHGAAIDPEIAGFNNPQPNERADILNFAVLTVRPKEESWARWQPLAEYLDREIQERRVMLHVLGRQELAQAVADRTVDVILTQPAQYVRLAQEWGLHAPLATLVESELGIPLTEYGGVIVTRADHPTIHRLRDLRGAKVGGIPVGLAAYQAPAYELLGIGITAKDYRLVEFDVPLDTIVHAVSEGTIDAGFIRSGVLEQMAREGQIRLEDFRVLVPDNLPPYPLLLSTRLYPQWGLAAMPWLDTTVARKVAGAVLSLPHGGEVAQAAGVVGFTIPADYGPVEDLMRKLRMPPFDHRVPFDRILTDYRDWVIAGLMVAIVVLIFGFAMAVRAYRQHCFARAAAVRLSEYRQLVFELSSSFINLPLGAVPEAIQAALGRIGQFFQADRSYIFRYDFAAETLTNTEEWCAPGIEPQIDTLQAYSMVGLKVWIERHRRGESILVPDVAHLPDRALRTFLQAQNIRSVVALPLLRGKECIGFVGLDWVNRRMRYSADEVDLLFLFNRMLLNLEDRRQLEIRLREAANVFEHTNEGIMITDAQGFIVDVNRAFSRITGYTREEVLGQDPSFLNSGRHGPEFFAAMHKTLRKAGSWTSEIWNRRKNGELFVELQTINAIYNADGSVHRYVSLFSDITQIKNQQHQLEQLSHYDLLTGLPNRVLLTDRLQQAIAQAKRHGQQLGVVFLDLDHFKAINEKFGHELGDRLLVQLAKRIRTVLRFGDDLARLGGDEFVVVFLDLETHAAAELLFERLLAAVSQPVQLDGCELRVNASIGASFYPQDEEVDADQLIRQADQAMILAKQHGRNRFHLFDSEEDRALRTRIEDIGRIRLALEEQEFVLHYQPKVNMRTGAVIGAEALLRWQHPERGLLYPGEFLPLIDEHELIVHVGHWVLETALRQMTAWRAQGIDLPVSINVAGRQFQDPEWVTKISAALQRYPVPSGYLELEVLESSALEDIGHVSQIIAACSALGVEFALDDFGTGYSSLTYLRRLSARTLKIDQSFVRDMLDDVDDLAILDGIIALAAAFQRESIAEGVETPAHAEILLCLGCEQGQGYAISRPLPAEKLPEWIRTWRAEGLWARHAPIQRGDLPVLFALVEQRAWVRASIRFAQDVQPIPPVSSQAQERFEAWLSGFAATRFAAHPELPHIVAAQRKLGQRVDRLQQLKADGRGDALADAIMELESQRDELQRLLLGLLAGTLTGSLDGRRD